MANIATDLDDLNIKKALREFGLEETEDNIEHLRVLAQAMGIYQEREQVRGGLWKVAGAVDSAHHLRSKGARVKHAVDHGMPEAGLDDALDAVNYAAFYVRNVRSKRLVES